MLKRKFSTITKVMIWFTLEIRTFIYYSSHYESALRYFRCYWNHFPFVFLLTHSCNVPTCRYVFHFNSTYSYVHRINGCCFIILYQYHRCFIQGALAERVTNLRGKRSRKYEVKFIHRWFLYFFFRENWCSQQYLSIDLCHCEWN